MGLTTITFYLFLIITLLLYFLVPRKYSWLILLIASIYFLLYDNLKLNIIIYLLIILLSSYIFAILIDKYNKKKKLFLILGILCIIGVLGYLKYTNLFIVTINHLNNILGINKQFNLVDRNVPIGLSYYSLIMIGYLTDVYWGICKPCYNILKCSLFMGYFPLLTSGPFVRYEDMEKELYIKHKFNFHRLCYGLIRIFWGLFKILVISQRIGIFVDAVYSNYTLYQGFYLILAALLFSLQLYTNFSGSIDIIMGVTKIIGINLPENFTSPFFSKSLTEFWRRWHITLGSWLKDYIFYPVMRSRLVQKLGEFTKKIFGKRVSKKVMLYFSMFIMWFAIGAWHNGAYTYIIGSGLLQCLIMILEDLLSPLSKRIDQKLGINRDTFGYRCYQMIRTYLIFSFTMIFFRAPSVREAFNIIKNMFVFNPWILLDNYSLYLPGLDLLDFRILFIAIIVLFIIDYLKQKCDVIEEIFKQNIIFRYIVIYILIFSVIIFGMYGPGFDATTFIYRQF